MSAGWSRSVGGANPYLALFSRTGASRQQVDQLALDLELFELPCARGCTYVVPRDHFEIALRAGSSFGEGDYLVATRHLGVTDSEIHHLCERVLVLLESGPKEPSELKSELGDTVRSLGPEGKKRGQTTTLPLALGRLQRSGQIRRQPVNGRLDTQKYRYELWLNSPITDSVTSDQEVAEQVAGLFFGWIGIASLAQFVKLSGFGAKLAKDTVRSLSLSSVPGTDLLGSAADLDSLSSFQPSPDPFYRLVGSIDNMFHLRRDIGSLLDSESQDASFAGVQDLNHHAILDRGRLVGFWDYDVESSHVRWRAFEAPSAGMRAAVSEVEEFVRDQLGDARTFSLDSPESRKKRLASLPLP